MHGRIASLPSKVGYKLTFQIMKAFVTLRFNPFNGTLSVIDSVRPRFLKLGLLNII